MTSWIIGSALFLILAITVVLLRLNQRNKRQREAVRQVRESRLYAHVYPLLLRCQELPIEQVALRRDGLYIRLYQPAGRMMTYVFERHGFHPVPTEKLYPMAQALAVDMKALGDPQKFTFHPHTLDKGNGITEESYEYHITNAFKDASIRHSYRKP